MSLHAFSKPRLSQSRMGAAPLQAHGRESKSQRDGLPVTTFFHEAHQSSPFSPHNARKLAPRRSTILHRDETVAVNT